MLIQVVDQCPIMPRVPIVSCEFFENLGLGSSLDEESVSGDGSSRPLRTGRAVNEHRLPSVTGTEDDLQCGGVAFDITGAVSPQGEAMVDDAEFPGGFAFGTLIGVIFVEAREIHDRSDAMFLEGGFDQKSRNLPAAVELARNDNTEPLGENGVSAFVTGDRDPHDRQEDDGRKAEAFPSKEVSAGG